MNYCEEYQIGSPNTRAAWACAEQASWSAQACTGQAQAELDGSTCAVYLAP